MIIDRTYFNGDILIPNYDKPTTAALIDWYINMYEAKFMRALMGESLYQAYKVGVVIDPIPAKWGEILNGAGGENLPGRQVWKGLTYLPGDNPDYKKSPIANYVYFKFMEKTYTRSTGSGESKARLENADAASPGPKMVAAWNEMVEEVQAFWDFTQARPLVYTEWSSTHRYLENSSEIRYKINEYNI